MADSERLVRITLLGQEYKFYTGASETEMDKILALVKKLMEDTTAGNVGAIPVNKVAVLACLNIASRYVKLKQEFDNYKGETEGRLNRINKDIQGIVFKSE